MACCEVVLRKAHRQQDVFLCGGESAMPCAESGKQKMPIAATMAMMHKLARALEISPGNTICTTCAYTTGVWPKGQQSKLVVHEEIPLVQCPWQNPDDWSLAQKKCKSHIPSLS